MVSCRETTDKTRQGRTPEVVSATRESCEWDMTGGPGVAREIIGERPSLLSALCSLSARSAAGCTDVEVGLGGELKAE